jgi:RNA polymerase sigma factor (sigma-70 family)
MSIAVLPQPLDAFRGLPEACRDYFDQNCGRIYYYLLRQTRDQAAAKGLSENTFIALFKSNMPIGDEDYLLRRLYLIARVSFLLYQRGKATVGDLLAELAYFTQDVPTIMDDPDVVCNESLLTLQSVMQELIPEQLEIAELFFFQGLTARSIAHYLHIDEEQVRSYLTQALFKLNEALSTRAENRKSSWRRIPALTPLSGGHAA